MKLFYQIIWKSFQLIRVDMAATVKKLQKHKNLKVLFFFPYSNFATVKQLVLKEKKEKKKKS